jgi:hypothetical protein
VDGVQTEWQVAYTAVRATCLPAGEHLIEWRFQPWIFAWGGLLSFLGLLLLAVAARQHPRS